MPIILREQWSFLKSADDNASLDFVILGSIRLLKEESPPPTTRIQTSLMAHVLGEICRVLLLVVVHRSGRGR